ncbi:MAG: T9SS type A sorting domain-containing protein [Bacteroidales bacterium]|jgi:Tol biopolymer transport system component
MKTIHIILFAFLSFLDGIGQVTGIDYFGQTPPGDSAIVFAPDIISLPNRYNQHGSFSPDGNEFCFTVTTSDWAYCNLYYTKIETDEWIDPQKADFVSGSIWDPSFTPDGNNLIYTYITSTADLWMLEKAGDSWGNPIKLGSPVSSGSPEFSPSVSLNGTIYFFSRRSFDIYRAIKKDGYYDQVEKLQSPINDFNDREPYIAPDESYMIFTSYDRPDQFGEGDLYISYNINNEWTEPLNLGSKINSEYWEFAPRVTPDNNYLLFTKRDESKSMILWVSASFIEGLKPTGIHNISSVDTELTIFPNPANNMVYIKYTGNMENVSYAIFTLQGNIILDGDLNSNSIDISQIPDGLYFFRIELKDEIITKKIIKH